MRKLAIAVVLSGCSWLAGCDDRTSSAPPTTAPSVSTSPGASAAPSPNQDVEFFTRQAQMPLAHFRVTWTQKAAGQTVDAQGAITEGKTYFATDPVVADFYLEPGGDRFAVHEISGKRIALYLKNLRVVNGHAQADVYGVGNNFGFRSPPQTRIGGGQSATRNGTQQAPQPTVFAVGKPVTGGTSMHGSVAKPPHSNFSIVSAQHYSIELVEITTLSAALKDDPSLDNPVPDGLDKAAERDLAPATAPAAD